MKTLGFGLALCLALGAAVGAQETAIPARLTLDEALRIADERNPSLVSARAVVAMAEADVATARTRPNPADILEVAPEVVIRSGEARVVRPHLLAEEHLHALPVLGPSACRAAYPRQSRNQLADPGFACRDPKPDQMQIG